jgi:OmcA/MtrC family decaheme c-type cytochrome
MNRHVVTRCALPLAFAVALGISAVQAQAQEALDWESSRYFQFNLQPPTTSMDATGHRVVTVLFSVTNPENGQQPWDIQRAPEFKQPAGASRLSVNFGWSTADYQNTGSAGEGLPQVPFRTVNNIPSGGGVGLAPALPVMVDALRNAIPAGPSAPGWYAVSAVLPAQASQTGVAMIEGHPAWAHPQVDGTTIWERVPVQSAFEFFSITDPQPVPRRAVVDIARCQSCHDGEIHKGLSIPRLSLHGGNRTEELNVCVSCHNPNQTDIGYRTSGDEVPMDFKYLIHAIHGAKHRESPLVVVGFRGALTDFSNVRPPADVRNCYICHIDRGGKGSFELPVDRSVLGTTLHSGSVPGHYVDTNPANDLKMTPTVGACSACHDDNETLAHMMSRKTGGSFAALQSDISSGRIVERCADCHGPGKKKDVRKVHGAKQGGTSAGLPPKSNKSEDDDDGDDDDHKRRRDHDDD